MHPRFKRPIDSAWFAAPALLLCAALWAATDVSSIIRLAEKRFGENGREQLTAWQTMVSKARDLPELEKVRRTNLLFNLRVRWDSDANIWGQEDFWATPLETLGKGLGDCEDFSIAKYATLLELGVPPAKLRLIYVKALFEGQSVAHMVLGYFPEPNGIPLILDNINGEVLPATQRRDLTPVFSFNSAGLWAGGKAVSDPTKRLSHWRSVLDRMAAEGFAPLALHSK